MINKKKIRKSYKINKKSWKLRERPRKTTHKLKKNKEIKQPLYKKNNKKYKSKERQRKKNKNNKRNQDKLWRKNII